MNVKKLIAMAAVMFSVSMMHAQSCDGLKIHYLGANHSLIRVEQPQKYLLLPGRRIGSGSHHQGIGK